MATYTFNTNLLSAVKTGNPPLIGTSLSANGVQIVSLSTNDIGIAFNSRSTLNNVLSTITINGSVFNIDTAYRTDTMAVIQTNRTYSVFLSAANANPVLVANIASSKDISTPNQRRLWGLGYY